MWCKYCSDYCGFFNTVHIDCEKTYNYLKSNLESAFINMDNDDVWIYLSNVINSPFIAKWYLKNKLNLNLQNKESIVWIFEHARYCQMKNTIQIKGVQEIDQGKMCITTKNIYFIGQRKNLKIPFNKLISIDSIRLDGKSNSIKLQRDVANANFQYFITDQSINDAERKFALDLLYTLNVINN